MTRAHAEQDGKGAILEQLEPRMLLSASISGQKFDDFNANGVRDPGEPGVDGWAVELVNVNTGLVGDTAVTDSIDLDGSGDIDPESEAGLYSFDVLNPEPVSGELITQLIDSSAESGFHILYPGWSLVEDAPGAYNNDCRLDQGAENKAWWVFEDLPKAVYQVWTSWGAPEYSAGPYPAGSNVPYTVYEGGTITVIPDPFPFPFPFGDTAEYTAGDLKGTRTVDHSVPASGEQADGIWWQSLGSHFIEGQMVVEIQGPRDVPAGETHYAFADAVRIEGLSANYIVCEVNQVGWTQSSPADQHYGVFLEDGQSVEGQDFGNYQPASVSGQKFEDLDGDGEKDDGEPGLDDWRIELVDPSTSQVVDTAVTSGGGLYSFDGVIPGDYELREVARSGWAQTHPDPEVHSVHLVSGDAITGKDFGNRKRLSTTYVVDSLLDTTAADGVVTLREAIEAANTNLAVNEAPAGSSIEADIITFDGTLAGGTITLGGTQLLIADDLEICGLGAENLTIDAGGQSRVFYVNANIAAGFDGLLITGGNDPSSGGGIYAGNSSSITVSNSTISGNSIGGPTHTSHRGGGIYGRDDSSITVIDSTISDNMATTQAYASRGYGGGIYGYTGSTITVTGSTISGNASSQGAGAIQGDTITVTDSIVIENTGHSNEGAINGTDITVTDSTVSDNLSRGIYGYEGAVTVIGSVVSGNAGWGVITYGTSDITVIGSTISNNVSIHGEGGGIIGAQNGTLTVEDSVIRDHVGGDGGIRASSTVLITDSVISGNTSERGGGLDLGDDANVTIIGSTIRNNRAKFEGGGIHIDRSNVSIADSIIVDNSAGSAGGGIFNYRYSSLVVMNSTVAGNTVRAESSYMYYGGGAGIIAYDNSSSEVINSTVIGNTAPGQPGYEAGISGPLTMNNSVVAMNTATGAPDDIGAYAGVNNFVGTEDGNPMLSTVTDSEGTILYYIPLPGSPLIDAGDNIWAVDPDAQPLATDQRGRDRIVNAAVDIGSVEFIPQPELHLSTPTLSGIPEGESAPFSVSLTMAPSAPVTVEIAMQPGGSSAISADTSELTFGVDDWNVPQPVTLTVGQDEDVLNDGAFFSVSAPDMDTLHVHISTVDDDPQVYVVDSLTDVVADDGVTTLREAIQAANTNMPVNEAPVGSVNRADIVTFDPSLAGGTITLGGTELEITEDLEIRGLGAEELTIDADSQSRVFWVETEVSVVFDALTITGGRNREWGGGIYGEWESAITVTNSTITGNLSGETGGGIHGYEIVVANSTISGNIADEGEGSHSAGDDIGGAGIYGNGAIAVTDSTISGNAAIGGAYGGGIRGRGDVAVSNSTISYNTAERGGGGIYCNLAIVTDSAVFGNSAGGVGGGILGSRGATVTNSVISGNVAQTEGGGIHSYSNSIIEVTNSTVSGNTSETRGGGIDSLNTIIVTNSTIVDNISESESDTESGGIQGGSVMLQNTVVSGNISASNADVRASTLTGSSYFIGSDDGDPMLRPIIDADGMILYYMPAPGSPLIDAGDNALAVDPEGLPLTTDHRGEDRIVGAAVDIGAIEFPAEPELTVAPQPVRNIAEGESTVFGVSLTHAPSTPVTVTVARQPGGSGDISADVSVLEFNAGNWNASRPVTITAAQDADNVNDTAAFALSAPGMDTVYVSVTSMDDDGQLYVVDSLDDTVAVDGALTLREAVTAANTNAPVNEAPGGSDGSTDIITFDASLSGGTITLGGTQLEITEDLEIYGLGAEQIAIDGGGLSRVFSVDGGSSVLFDSVTISGGRSIGEDNPDGDGAGIYGGEDSTIIVTNSTISGNFADGYGGGIYTEQNCTIEVTGSALDDNSADEYGGGVYANGDSTITVTDSTITDNYAGDYGGGICAFNDVAVVVTNSEVSGNSARIFGGGIYVVSPLTVTNSTISGNSSSNAGGGIRSGVIAVTDSAIRDNSGGDGGGIYGYTVTMTDCTVSGNSGGLGGGVYGREVWITGSTISGNSGSDGGGIYGSLRVGVTNSTICDNSARKGGGIYNTHFTSTAITVTNSTIVDNSAQEEGGGIRGADCDETIWLNNAVIARNTSDLFDNICGPLQRKLNSFIGSENGDPMLTAVTDTGGTILYYIPQAGSPLLDAGDNSLAVDRGSQPLTTDQRGRNRIVNGTVDIGSIELSAEPELSITPRQVLEMLEGESRAFDVSLTSAPSAPITVNVARQPGGSEDLSADLSILEFDADNWHLPQTVAILAAQDADRDNESAFFAVSASDMDTVYISASAIDDDFQTYVVDSLLDVMAADGLLTLREAIQAANTNAAVNEAPEGSEGLTDIIAFAGSLSGGTITLDSVQLDITDDLEIRGLGADQLTIDAQRHTRIFGVGAGVSASLSGLTLTGGNANTGRSDNWRSGYGGAILGDDYSVIEVTDSAIDGHSAYYYGGGIYASTGSVVTIANSSVSDNSARDSGGGIYGSDITVIDSTIGGNSGAFGGGLTGSEIIVTDSVISDNSATHRGGGINGSAITVTDSTISGNSAGGYDDRGGGGISGAVITVTGSVISGNSSYRAGGGICGASDGAIAVTDSTISGNSTDQSGGGISSEGAITVVDSLIADNSAIYDGGGIHGLYGSAITVMSSMIRNNSAISAEYGDNGFGGGIYAGDSIAVTNSTISGNSAYESGGGIHAHYWNGVLTVTNSTIAGNTSLISDGGGIYGDSESDIILRNTVVSGNAADSAADVSGTLSPVSSNSFIGAADGDPMLTAVTDADGTILHYMPHPDSPLVDAGDNSLAIDPDGLPLTTDNRGQSRVVNAVVDIGAIELPAEPELAVTQTPSVDMVEGESRTFEVSLTSAPSSPVTVSIARQPGGSDDISADLSVLTFDAGDWSVPRPVTITAAQDADLDNDGAAFAVTATGMDTVYIFVSARDDDHQTYVVDSLSDDVAEDGVLTLREAIQAANTNDAVNEAPEGSEGSTDVITFAESLSGGTITLGGTQLEITEDLDIQGLGADQIAVDGADASRVFYVHEGVRVSFADVTVSGGRASGNSDYLRYGGGIEALDGSVITVTRSTIRDNWADWKGGGIHGYDFIVIAVTDSTFSGNTGDSQISVGDYAEITVTNSTMGGNTKGGAIGAGSYSELTVMDSAISGNTGGGGVGVGRYSELTVTNSTISDNAGYAIYGDNDGLVTVTNSTVSGNFPAPNRNGGGISGSGVTITDSTISNNVGRGIYGLDLTVTNSRIAGNSAAVGGGIYFGNSLLIVDSAVVDNSSSRFGGGISSGDYGYADNLWVINSTISNNSALEEGGGIYINSVDTAITNSTIVNNSSAKEGGGIYRRNDSDPCVLNNTILTLNTADGSPQIKGAYTQSHSFIDGGDPMLISVTDGEGHLRYYVPEVDSPVVDAGSNALAVDVDGDHLATDQIGQDRIFGTSVDIGAVEYHLRPQLVMAHTAETDILEGESTTFSVELTAPPLAPVTVSIDRQPGGSSEISTDVSVLVFDDSNWDVPRTVTITSSHDADRDDDDTATFALSAPDMDTVYVTVSVEDDDYHTYVVDSLADVVAADGFLTLREAVEAVNTSVAVNEASAGEAGRKDIITFDPSLAGGTLVLDGQSIWIRENLDIVGLGADQLTIDADGRSSVFAATEGITAVLDSMTITGGYSDGNAGGIYCGPYTSIVVRNSIIKDNSAEDGGGIYAYQYGSITVMNSSIIGNTADDWGGGIFAYEKVMVTVANSTISGNTCGGIGGGIFSEGRGGEVILTNSTVVGNSAAEGGGVYHGGYVRLRNSVVAGNTASRSFDLSPQDNIDSISSFIGDDDGDPMLRPVIDADATVLYYVPKEGSPLIDAGDNSLAIDPDGEPLATDQRGRNRIAGAAVDIGATELSTETELLIATTPLLDVVEGDPFPLEVSLTSAPSGPVTVSITMQPGGSDDVSADVSVLEFDTDNWHLPQAVTVTADDDADRENDDTATFALSADGMDTVYVFVSVQDDDYQTYVVDSLVDVVAVDGFLTLREAIRAANTNAAVNEAPAGGNGLPDLVTFDESLSGGTIGLGGTQLDITEDIIIRGLGADQLTLSGRGGSRVFHVDDGVSALFEGLTITGGADGSGGGIFVDQRGAITVTDSTISGNSVSSDGGGIYGANSSEITVTRSTISDNSAGTGNNTEGGGIYGGRNSVISVTDSTISGNSTWQSGGGIYGERSSTVTVTNSDVRNNSASAGAGIYGYEHSTVTVADSVIADNSGSAGAGIYVSAYGTLILTNSAISGNSASSSGGGFFGGSNGTVIVTNSTFAENSAQREGGGIWLGSHKEEARIVNSTIKDNSAGEEGGGITNYWEGATWLHNSVVADNTAPLGADIYTIASTNISNSFIGADDGDPMFRAVRDAHGAVLYYIPDPGSPVIDAGDNLLAVDAEGLPITVDQRGRNRVVNAIVDIGAVEFHATPQLVLTPETARDMVEGESQEFDVSLTSEPLEQVTVTVDKLPGGSEDISVDVSMLVFDASNWNAPRTVTVTADHDTDRDNEAAVFALSSSVTDTVYINVFAKDDDYQTYVVDSLLDVVAPDGRLTLREAIQAANTNTAVNEAPEGSEGLKDVITFAESLSGGTITLGGTELSITDNLVIRGLGAEQIAIDADRQSRVFSVGEGVSVLFEDMTISGGYAVQNNEAGAGIRGGENTDIVVRNSVIANNEAYSGGGIFAQDRSAVSIVDSTISDNKARHGGGVSGARYGTITVTGSTISGNSVGDSGGGINVYEKGAITVTDSTVSDNTAGYYGGGISGHGVTILVTNSIVADNTSQQLGGGIYGGYGDGSVLEVTDSVISGNSGRDGGGIWGGSVEVTNTTISGTVNGNGIFTAGSMVLTGCTLSGNLDGAMYSRNNITLDSCTVSNNVERAVQAQDDVLVTNSRIINNDSSGIFGSDVTVMDSLIAYNSGSGVSSFSGRVEVINSTIAHNTATNGGGISVSHSSVTVTNSTIVNNSATSSSGGGGIWKGYNNNPCILNNTVVALNTAPDSPQIKSAYTQSRSFIGGDPVLGAVTDREGALVYYLPLPGSPLIDTGSNALAVDTDGNPLATDQIGHQRIFGPSVDIGAIEFMPGDPPTDISLSAATVAENLPAGTTVGTLSSTDPDPDAIHTYTLVVGAGDEDNGAFSIDGDMLKTDESLNFEVQSFCNIRIRSTNQTGALLEKTFTISVTDVNDQPFVAHPVRNVVVNEDAADTALDLSGVFDDSDSGDSLVLTLTGNTNAGLVTTDVADEQLTLVYAADQNGTAKITVRATDLSDSWIEDTFTVMVNPANDQPFVQDPIDGVTVDEDAPDTVLDVSNIFGDIDLGDSLNLSVSGNTDPALVSANLAGDHLTLSYAADQSGTAEITVRATDSGGAHIDDTLLVTVNPTNDPPFVENPIANVTVAENAPDSVLDLSVAFDDIDPNDILTLSVTGNTDPGLAVTSVDGAELTLSYGTNRHGATEITVRATDSAGAWAEDTFTVTVISDGIEQPIVANPIADVTIEANASDSVLDLSAVFEETASILPTLDYTAVEIDPVTGAPTAGTGLFAYTFTLYGNDGVDASFTTMSLTFTGPIRQTTFNWNNVDYPAHDEGIANVFHNPPDYNKYLDTWRYSGWTSTVSGDSNLPPANFFDPGPQNGEDVIVSAYTGTTTHYQQKDLVYIVADGDVQWSGSFIRQGATYDTSGTAGGNRLTLSVEGNTNQGLVTASVLDSQLTLVYAPDTVGSADITIRATDSTGAWVENTFNVTVSAAAEVVARHIFYNNSVFDGGDPAANANDDSAIATDKTPLLAGRTATYPNYTSYGRGINGIMIDVDSLESAPTGGDFRFRVGNDSDPGAWGVLGGDQQPDITVRPGAGVGGSDRITLIWEDNVISGQWLEVTVLAGGNIPLADDDVFWFGNAPGETGNSATDAVVDEADRLLVRNNPHTFLNPAPVDDACDFNRDQKVNATDELIARDNRTTVVTALKLITAPGASPAAAAPMPGDADGNNTVDAADMAVFWSTFGQRGADLAADFSGDGRVNLADFTIIKSNLGRTQTQPAAAPSAAHQDAVLGAVENTDDDGSALIPVAHAASIPPADLLARSKTPDGIETRRWNGLIELPSLPGDFCGPLPMNEDSSVPYNTATAEYDLRPLGDDPATAGQTDDLLADILAESPVTMPL